MAAVLTTIAAAAVAASPGAQQADKGEQAMNVSCTNCHDLRPIQTQALDTEGWTSVVAAMEEDWWCGRRRAGPGGPSAGRNRAPR